MPRPEEFPIKFTLAITQEMEREINDWRRRQDDLPTKTESVRRLIERALGKCEPERSTDG